MWSTLAGGQLMKVVNLTGFTVYGFYEPNAVYSTAISNIFQTTEYPPKENIFLKFKQ
jgi:hypothetical protein